MSTDNEVITMCHQSHDAVFKLIVRCNGMKQDIDDDNLEPINATDTKPTKTSNYHKNVYYKDVYSVS